MIIRTDLLALVMFIVQIQEYKIILGIIHFTMISIELNIQEINQEVLLIQTSHIQVQIF